MMFQGDNQPLNTEEFLFSCDRKNQDILDPL